MTDFHLPASVDDIPDDLPARDRAVIAMRAGLGDEGRPMSLSQVADVLGLSLRETWRAERAAVDAIRRHLSNAAPPRD